MKAVLQPNLSEMKPPSGPPSPDPAPNQRFARPYCDHVYQIRPHRMRETGVLT